MYVKENRFPLERDDHCTTWIDFGPARATRSPCLYVRGDSKPNMWEPTYPDDLVTTKILVSSTEKCVVGPQGNKIGMCFLVNYLIPIVQLLAINPKNLQSLVAQSMNKFTPELPDAVEKLVIIYRLKGVCEQDEKTNLKLKCLRCSNLIFDVGLIQELNKRPY